MYKWYVTRGYPLSELVETTGAERVLLKEAYNDWLEMWSGMAKATEGDRTWQEQYQQS